MQTPTDTSVFARIVCGVDGSVQALEAARQARALLAPAGTLALVSVVPASGDPSTPHGPGGAPSEAEQEAGRRLRLAADVGGGDAETRVLHGSPVRRLTEELEESQATLVAVGAKGDARTSGILMGSVTTALLHESPCAVLVARHAQPSFPDAIVVGWDGSEPAERAVAAGRELAAHTGAELRIVAAGDAARRGVLPDGVEIDDRAPLLALVEASKDVDLVVVGRRGLRGLRALGSVSERLGHEAACSVLVVH